MNVRKNMPYGNNRSLLEALLKKQKNKAESNRILKMNNGGISDPTKRRTLAELPNRVEEQLFPFLDQEESFAQTEARKAAQDREFDNFMQGVGQMQGMRGSGREGTPEESAMLRQDFGIDDFQVSYLSPTMRKLALSFLDRSNPRNQERDALKIAARESADLARAVAGGTAEDQLFRLAYYAAQNPNSRVAEEFREQAKYIGMR
jgi:hypothetical protein